MPHIVDSTLTYVPELCNKARGMQAGGDILGCLGLTLSTLADSMALAPDTMPGRSPQALSTSVAQIFQLVFLPRVLLYMASRDIWFSGVRTCGFIFAVAHGSRTLRWFGSLASQVHVFPPVVFLDSKQS